MSARGTTSIPEESNITGHDSQPGPSPIAPPVPSGEHAAPARSRGINPVPTSKVLDVKFVADEFDVPERRAAAVVSGPEASEDEVISLAAKVHQKKEQDDPLGGVPTPREDTQDLRTDADETALKPMVREPNRRVGGG